MNNLLRYASAIMLAAMICFLCCDRNPASSDGNQLEFLSAALFSGPYYSMEVEGDYAYCGAEGSFQIISLVDRENPVFVGGVSAPNYIYDVDVEGNYAYLGAREDGLIICDVSNRERPEIVGNWDPPEDYSGRVYEVYVTGNYAVIANYYNGLQIIDISDPANPVRVGNYDEFGFDAIYFYVSGDYVYINGRDDQLIIDISDPSNPVQAGNFGSGYGRIDGAGDYLCHIRNDASTYIDIYSITNPVEPVLIGSLEGDFSNLSVTGNCIYALEPWNPSEGDVTIIDISNPTMPQIAGTYSTPNRSNRILAKEGYLYVYDYLIDEIGSMYIADIANPLSPVEVGNYIPGGGASDVFVFDNYAYAVSNHGLHIVDVSDARNPVDMGHHDIGEFGSVVEVFGSYMFVVGERTFGLEIYDISNLNNPVLMGIYSYGDESAFYDIAVKGNYAYVAGRENGLDILDISDPSAPLMVSQIDSICAVYVRDDYCYAGGFQSSLSVFDITDPSNPILLGECESNSLFGGIPFGLNVVGQFAYMPIHYGGVKIIDVSDPSNPTLVGEYETMVTDEVGFFAVDDRVYLPMVANGLHIIDVSDPAGPVLDVVIENGYLTYGAYAVDDIVYVADASSLRIYRYQR